MTTADKIAANTMILVLSRLAMLATPILLSAVGGIFWLYLDSIAADASAAVETAAGLKTRVTLIESTPDGRPRGPHPLSGPSASAVGEAHRQGGQSG